MQIAVLSDTHSNMATTGAACGIIRALAPAAVVHCGDVDTPEAVAPFAELKLPVHFTFGNCDWDRAGLQSEIEQAQCQLHPDWGQLTIAGLKLAFTHGHRKHILNRLVCSGEYHFVFCGHSHLKGKWHQESGTWLINPGALHRARERTFGVLDTESQQFEWMIV